MWTGQGPREARQAVSFADRYLQPPAVMVSISMWDLDRRSNTRADNSAENVTADGFDLVFRTWGDTRVARIRADWTALGPVRDEARLGPRLMPQPRWYMPS
ncbi:H-type lectin domain-containing protein [Rhodobacter sp. CZR27]|uniref:H-type lectin domain-containing protein n=1 Tax=Rhodobacter sp. CZR27 TaxID=2033869 RepID=UPI001E4FDB0D|nr:H-type lectin domain-containing protein [Rhodobacter sp. CZR27]